MRIKCDTVNDFVVNLQAADRVIDGKVYIQRTMISLTDQPVRMASSRGIGLQCSAIVESQDGVQALLECGVDCGIDRLTADGDLSGTETYDDLRDLLAKYVHENNLNLLPGVLDI